MNAKSLLFSIVVMAFFFGCTKEKRYENKLEGNTFNLSLSVDENNLISNNVHLTFNDCKNRKEFCTGEWETNEKVASFYWKFSKNGKQFELSNITQIELNTPQYSGLEYCYKCSGVYKVQSFKNGTLDITSTETKGYSGQQVKIILKKKG